MIEFKNISINFKQKKGILPAVKDVSFSIKSGEIFGIAGSSGAGKSTLLRTVNLLQSIDNGHLIVDGKDVTNYRGRLLREHRRQIGMIFQHFNLASNLTVYQNIAFVLKTMGKSKKETDEKVREYLSLVGISEKADVYPSKLSGGQKQRVAIARALAGGAKILLCDEPTSALDVEATASILSLLKSLNKKLNITVIIITHELEIIKSICNRMAIMDDGKLVELGGVYELFTDCKQGFTRQFIGHSHKFELPRDILENTEGLIVKLTFRGDTANTPVISDATAKFGVQFNILIGRIEYIENKPVGVLYVNPVGEKQIVNQIIEYLKQVVKEVEVIEK